MEIFGIMFSLPVAFATSAVYSYSIGKFVRPKVRLSGTLMTVSLVVLFLWLVELLSVIIFGSVAINDLISSSFYRIHLVLFFLSVPSLATVLMLQPMLTLLTRWYIAALGCTFFALIAVLLQYGVSEALFGID